MGQFWDAIPPSMIKFIKCQKLFFVATAPLSDTGRVNLSPKGYDDTFAIVSDTCVAYLDLGGSGVETYAHVKENGRITFMFCNMEAGSPGIYRLWGRAKAYERGTPEYDTWVQKAFGAPPDYLVEKGSRSIIVADIYQCAHSCGYAVPVFEFKQDRDSYLNYVAKMKGEDGLKARKGNVHSLDGLPALSLPDPSVYCLPEGEDTIGLAKLKAAAVKAEVHVSAGGSSKGPGKVFPAALGSVPTILVVVLAWLCGAIMAKAM